jgi:hypothetical protein
VFVTSKSYEKALRELIAEEGELVLAVAFWGQGAEKIVHSRPGRKLKMICNLQSGATNPETIDRIRRINQVEVKQHDRLHAKVLAGARAALIGSANLSCNGLNLEAEELKGWEEAGFVTKDSEQLRVIRTWFRSLWKKARPVEDEDLQDARIRWKRRRSTRIKTGKTTNQNYFTLEGLSRSDLRDRPVYLAIYRDHLSNEARDAYRKEQQKMGSQKSSTFPKKLPPMYEGWPELPKNAYLIDLYYGKLGSLQCDGVFTRVFDIKFKYRNRTTGHLAICRKENDIFGQQFPSSEAKRFAESLKPYIKNIWNSPNAIGDESGKVIPLIDALQLINFP